MRVYGKLHANLGLQESFLQDKDLETIKAVHDLASRLHRGHKRRETKLNGEPYFYMLHIEEVAETFLNFLCGKTYVILTPNSRGKSDYTQVWSHETLKGLTKFLKIAICTALLHDTVEDLTVEKMEHVGIDLGSVESSSQDPKWKIKIYIENELGKMNLSQEEIVKIMEGVGFLTKPPYSSEKPTKEEKEQRTEQMYANLKKAPFWVRLIKLADNQSNAQSIPGVKDREGWEYQMSKLIKFDFEWQFSQEEIKEHPAIRDIGLRTLAILYEQWLADTDPEAMAGKLSKKILEQIKSAKDPRLEINVVLSNALDRQRRWLEDIGRPLRLEPLIRISRKKIQALKIAFSKKN